MQRIKIDFDNPGLPKRLDVMENDAQSRFFEAELYQGGKAYSAPSGATYSIMYRGFGPQNEGWYDTINDGAGKRAACTVSGNVVTCELARQALQVPGHVSVVLAVTASNGYMLHSWPIDCNCRNSNYNDSTEIASFFYITSVTNATWTEAIEAFKNFDAQIDKTLSLGGKAADSKVVGDAIIKTVSFTGIYQRVGIGFKTNESGGITYYSDSHRCCLDLTLPENVWSISYKTLVNAFVNLAYSSLSIIAVLLDADGQVVYSKTNFKNGFSDVYDETTLTHSDIPTTARTLVIQSIYRSGSDFPTATARVNRIDALKEGVSALDGSLQSLGLTVADGRLCVVYKKAAAAVSAEGGAEA